MLKLIKPYISFEEVTAEFKTVFESGWFTKGQFVNAFKEQIKSYTRAKHAFLTTSATTALSVALRILNIQAEDEVVISDFSFPATANVVEDIGAIPVFCDVDLETFNMLPTELERKITHKTKAVIVVDALGNPSGLHAIKSICQKYKLPLIEDAACSIGSEEQGVKCGNIADITCFSFHPRKLLTTGEGGAITTNNDSYAEQLEIKLNHGAKQRDGVFDFVDSGYNYRMSELQAVMGIKQLEKIDGIVFSRNEIREKYLAGLNGLGFKVQSIAEGVVHNIQSLVFTVPKQISRDKLINYLRDNGIESTLGTYCLSGTTYYKNKYDDVQLNAMYLQENTITLPCYDGLDVDFIIQHILEAVRQCG